MVYSADMDPLVPLLKLSMCLTVCCSRGTSVPPDYTRGERRMEGEGREGEGEGREGRGERRERREGDKTLTIN